MDQASNLRNIIKKKNTLSYKTNSSQKHNDQTNDKNKKNDKSKDPARVITITSGKGGVGKSNTSINLALELSKLGKRVILIDADLGLANVEILLGIRPKYNLSDLLYKDKTVSEIITYGPNNLGLISGGSGVFELMNLKKDDILKLTRSFYELDRLADVIIIDTGAGVSDNVTEFIINSSDVLLIVTPEPTSITDSYALLKSIARNPNFYKDKTSVKIISNGANSESKGLEIFQKISIVAYKYLDIDIEYLGMVPLDECVRKAVIKQIPYTVAYPNSEASQGIRDIAKKILIIDQEEKEEGKTTRGIVGMIYNFLKNKLD